jgi:hypothetical protein
MRGSAYKLFANLESPTLPALKNASKKKKNAAANLLT